jgi:3-hydroxybutyryl-CoA dehydratase
VSQGQGLTLDELPVGRSASRTHTVSDADIRAFADVSGDHNPVHLDDAYAAATPFKGRIAHGMLSGAWISALIAGELPGPGTIYLSQTMSFKRPVRIGDEVTVTATVSGVDEAKNRVTLATVCTVGGKAVVEGEAVVLAPTPAQG